MYFILVLNVWYVESPQKNTWGKRRDQKKLGIFSDRCCVCSHPIQYFLCRRSQVFTADCMSLLQTPKIDHTPARIASPVHQTTTPHSILKVSRLLRTSPRSKGLFSGCHLHIFCLIIHLLLSLDFNAIYSSTFFCRLILMLFIHPPSFVTWF